MSTTPALDELREWKGEGEYDEILRLAILELWRIVEERLPPAPSLGSCERHWATNEGVLCGATDGYVVSLWEYVTCQKCKDKKRSPAPAKKKLPSKFSVHFNGDKYYVDSDCTPLATNLTEQQAHDLARRLDEVLNDG